MGKNSLLTKGGRVRQLATCLSACFLLFFILSACGKSELADPVIKGTASEPPSSEGAAAASLTEGEAFDREAELPVEAGENILMPPASGAAKKGCFSYFDAVDLDGTAVDEGIFAGAKLSLVNVWGTFCPPCRQELPVLAKLSEEYKDDVRFTGIVIDALLSEDSYDADQVASARQIVADNRLPYPQLLPSPDLNVICLEEVQTIPATFFIDEDGKIIDRHVGALDEAGWRELIDRALENAAHE